MYLFFFFNDTATTEIYTLSLHDALPICASRSFDSPSRACRPQPADPAGRLQGRWESQTLLGSWREASSTVRALKAVFSRTCAVFATRLQIRAVDLRIDLRIDGKEHGGQPWDHSRRASHTSPGAWGASVRPSDRKSTRLNSSHSQISYAVFCLKKKN